MAHVITRTPRGKVNAQVPLAENGEPWPVCMRVGFKDVYADDVEDLVAVLTDDPAAYLAASEHDRLVARIRVAVRATVIAQAEEVCASQQDRRWDRLTAAERDMLLSARHVQPAGLHADLFGTDHGLWLADVTLYCVETGYSSYTDIPMISGPPERLKVIDPLTPESLLDGLSDEVGSIQIYIRAVDG